jgi:hypothetical protein
VVDDVLDLHERPLQRASFCGAACRGPGQNVRVGPPGVTPPTGTNRLEPEILDTVGCWNRRIGSTVAELDDMVPK